MYLIELSQIPNQTFTIMLDNVNYKIALRTIQDMTYMSVWANGEILFYNQLCVPNAFVNPYNYVSQGGKFYFRCLDSEYTPLFLYTPVNQRMATFITPSNLFSNIR